jgi:hypothetical protein
LAEEEDTMSLTFIAMIGILVGFLCLVIGFFMEDAKESTPVGVSREKRAKTIRKKVIVPRKKAA